MAISFAPCVFPADPLRQHFARETDRLPKTAASSSRERESAANSLQSAALNPPDDSLDGRLARIGRMLRRGDPVNAIEAAFRLLDNRSGLTQDITEKLQAQAAHGIEILKIMGRHHDAALYASRLQIAPPPASGPAAPRP